MRITDLNRRRFFNVNRTPNTFIGGIGSATTNKETLANHLGIDNPTHITYFEVKGNDVICRINVEYYMPEYAFARIAGNDMSLLTEFWDMEGKCTVLGNKDGGNQDFSVHGDSLTHFYFPNATYIGNQPTNWTFSANPSIILLYAPKILDWGPTEGDDNITRGFNSNWPNCDIHVHPTMETINNGGLEGDLQEIENLGGTIIFKDNYNKPNSITDLTYSGGNLNFSTPSSTNPLAFFEVLVNDFFHTRIQSSGSAVTGLNTGDSVTILACDTYYNFSKSNEIII